jgi:hypothetical protein
MAQEPTRIESPAYVPFEPRTDALRTLRSDLQAQLRSLAAEEGEVLGARFYGVLPRGADVENALLYNIDPGGGAFAAAARYGVRFEHQPTPLGSAGVRYEYGLEALAAGLTLWAPARPLATVDTRLEAPPTLARIWWALRERGEMIRDSSRAADEPFAGSLCITGPVRSARPTLVKTLVDGVVCALQSQADSEDVEAVAPLLSSSLGAPTERVIGHLLDDGRSALGTRARLVHRRGKGVQWAPDDDYCVAGEVLVEPAEAWKINGRRFAVAPR